MTYRVVQWATGLVGKESIKGVLAHPELELVGCWVHSPDKVGRDVGELCEIGPIGVQATGSIDEICALDADAGMAASYAGAVPADLALVCGCSAMSPTPT